MIYYQNAEIFNGQTLLEGYSLAVSDNKTTHIINDKDIPSKAKVIMLEGGILTPGYVELQANGGGGVLFNDCPTIDGIKTILKAHRQFGTVAMLPTFITDTPKQLDLAMQAVRQGLEQRLPGLIGGHFEGPFINPKKKGTHQPNFIRQPCQEDYQRFTADGLGNSLVTVAPECISNNFIRHLADQGFQINAGHTLANKEDMINAYHSGLRGVTHLYNAMPPLQGREPAVIGCAVSLLLKSSIIVDGIHSDAFAMQAAYKMLGKHNLMLVTDSMHTIGAPEIKSFTLTGQQVFVKNDRLVNENGDLAGAHITMEQSVKNAVKFMQISATEALTMAITTPATYINREDLSHITSRNIADILYLDRNTLSIKTLPKEE